jgi:hypothetical protein
MSPHAAAGHACVRVGPLGAGTLAAGWPEAHWHHCSQRHGGRTVTGTLRAADARSPAWRLETADVIVTEGGAGSAGPGDWLRRYPGCAITVAWAWPEDCSVATRDGVLRGMAVSGPSPGAALACAVFVYGWLGTGLRLSELRPARLHVSHSAGAGPVGGAPLFFRFSYCAASGDDPEASGSPARADSASRTCSASGAPSAS